MDISQASAIYYGDQPVSAVYYGSNEIWSNTPTPHDYSQDYLTFEALINNVSFSLSKISFRYSIDNGDTWVLRNAGASTTAINEGDKILIKASPATTSQGIGTFTATGNFNVEGNIMSLLYGDNFTNQYSLSAWGSPFFKLFYNNTYLINSENLILPATTLSTTCYWQMFNGCTNMLTCVKELPATTLADEVYENMFKNCKKIVEAPILPAQTLTSFCYNGMFNGCTSLNKVTCLATNISALMCTSSWLASVSARGTFVKDASMNSWTRNVDGIPSGWTVVNA